MLLINRLRPLENTLFFSTQGLALLADILRCRSQSIIVIVRNNTQRTVVIVPLLYTEMSVFWSKVVYNRLFSARINTDLCKLKLRESCYCRQIINVEYRNCHNDVQSVSPCRDIEMDRRLEIGELRQSWQDLFEFFSKIQIIPNRTQNPGPWILTLDFGPDSRADSTNLTLVTRCLLLCFSLSLTFSLSV